jgi:uncharacterized protein (TIGR00369 family)
VTDLTALVHESIPFSRALGITSVTGGAERVEASASWSTEHCTAEGTLHGGYLVAVADTIAATCAYLNLPEGARTATIELKTNFLQAVTEGDIVVVAAPVHVGRTTVVVQTDISVVAPEDGTRPLVTRTLQTQAIIPA